MQKNKNKVLTLFLPRGIFLITVKQNGGANQKELFDTKGKERTD